MSNFLSSRVLRPGLWMVLGPRTREAGPRLGHSGPLFTCWTQSPESSARGGHGALFVNTVLNICHLLLGNSAIGSLSFLLSSFIFLFPNFLISAISPSTVRQYLSLSNSFTCIYRKYFICRAPNYFQNDPCFEIFSGEIERRIFISGVEM